MEEHELASDAEPEAPETLKLTTRGRPAHSPTGLRRRPRDETKKEIQEDDEATLRELLIRYPLHSNKGRCESQRDTLIKNKLAILIVNRHLPVSNLEMVALMGSAVLKLSKLFTLRN